MTDMPGNGGWRAPESKMRALLLLTAAALVVAILRDPIACLCVLGGITLTYIGVRVVGAFKRSSRVIARMPVPANVTPLRRRVSATVTVVNDGGKTSA